MSAALKVDRAQVLAYRVAAQGLHREATAADQLAVLDIGVQEAMGNPAALSFANRLAGPVTNDSIVVGPGHRLAFAWTLRGAPHVHRRAQLNALAAALYPLSEADARGRLNETGPSIAAKGMSALDQLEAAVTQLHDVVSAPTAKGAVSTEVSRRVPAAMLRECRPCNASHLSDSAMRCASLLAGLEIEPGTSPPVLLPRKGAKRPTAPDRRALATLANAYLTVLGPATVTEVAGYLEARRADVVPSWPRDLVDVEVAGRAASLPADCVEALQAAPDAHIVRLLGPFDPYLQARDRELIAPDKAAHKALWPVLGRPGAVLADGEIVATWRPKSTAKLLTLTVAPFGALPEHVWSQVEAEAQVIATARGASDVAVRRA